MTEPLLQVRNLECRYGPVTALRGVSFDVAAGSIVTILGANGAGKSTLLQAIAGILQPHRGSIRLAGARLEGSHADEAVRRGLVLVPEGRQVFPLLSVGENLALGAYARRGAGLGEDLEPVLSYFPILRERWKQDGGALSGGEQQMLAIARGIMARPRVLLLDEPSLGLSPRLVAEIFAIVERLRRERGLAVLLVEQNAVSALALADRGHVMEAGRIVLSGSARQLQADDRVQEVYFGAGGRAPAGGRRPPGRRRKTWN